MAISCSFYDQLEEWATLKSVLTLQILDQVHVGKIKDFKTEKKKEFLLFDTREQEVWFEIASIQNISPKS